MADDAPAIPSDRAMALLRDRLKKDKQLDEKIREAVLEDLSSEKPTEFAKLKAALEEKGASNEADEPEGE